MKDQTEVAEAIREVDRKIMLLEGQGALKPGTFQIWNEMTCDTVAEVLRRVVEHDPSSERG